MLLLLLSCFVVVSVVVAVCFAKNVKKISKLYTLFPPEMVISTFFPSDSEIPWRTGKTRIFIPWEIFIIQNYFTFALKWKQIVSELWKNVSKFHCFIFHFISFQFISFHAGKYTFMKYIYFQIYLFFLQKYLFTKNWTSEALHYQKKKIKNMGQ